MVTICFASFEEGSLHPISLYLDISSASDNDILLGVTLRWFIASHSGLRGAGAYLRTGVRRADGGRGRTVEILSVASPHRNWCKLVPAERALVKCRRTNCLFFLQNIMENNHDLRFLVLIALVYRRCTCRLS